MSGGETGGPGEPPETPARSVLCLRTSALGDVIMLGPALGQLRAAGLEPILVTSDASLGAARCLTALRQILVVAAGEFPTVQHWVRHEDTSAPGWQHGGAELPPVVAVLDFQVTSRSRRALAALRRHIDLRGAPKLNCRRDRLGRFLAITTARWRGRGTDPMPRRLSDLHGESNGGAQALPLWFGGRGVAPVINRYDELVQRLLEKLSIVVPALPTGDVIASSALVPQRTFDCVVFTGASLPLKSWPAGNAAECARYLLAQGLTVAFAGGAAEASAAEDLAAACPGAVALAGKLDIVSTIDLVMRARFVVTTDSFPGHVRDLCGAPGLVLFGATSPILGFAPRGPQVQVASLGLGCSPCTRHGRGLCRYGDHRCMAGLGGEAVAKHVLAGLGTPAAVT